MDTSRQTASSASVGNGRERSVGQDAIPGVSVVVGKGAYTYAPPVLPTANVASAPTGGKVEQRPDRCRHCGSTKYRDVAIHDGLSVRRDCAKCRRFIAFIKWNMATV